jgi:hypothetical protein
LEKSNLKIVQKKYGWRFNWKQEFNYSDRQLFKLVIKGESIIQGLISLQVMDGFVEMHLIESAPGNIGHGKMYAGGMTIATKSAKKLVNLYYGGYFNT